MFSRRELCVRTAAALEKAEPACLACMIGFDGFVDSIVEVVDKRHSARAYDRVMTIDQMARKMAAAAGQSANYELVATLQKLGGNGPIMANALAAAGFGVMCVGALGWPQIHPVFAGLAARATLHSLCEPAYTDALEFTDGKLMLGKISTLAEITFERLVAQMGVDNLARTLDGAALVGMVNWTMLPHLTDLWRKLLEQIMPRLPKRPGAERMLFIDLADPEKRTPADLREALATLAKFEPYMRTILGLNLKESTQAAAVLDIAMDGDAEAAMARTAGAIRQRLGISCVVIHARRGAAAADGGESATFVGPFVRQPRISTGAGDHFNAGFCMGKMLGMTLAQCLCAGTAVSGYYVRNAASPTQGELAAFIGDMPEPQ